MLNNALVSKVLANTTPAPAETAAPARELGLPTTTLPTDHEELLSLVGGRLGYSGCFRLFSADRAARWNAPACWKFAWPCDLTDFFCFGETAWGDQYAYKLE